MQQATVTVAEARELSVKRDELLHDIKGDSCTVVTKAKDVTELVNHRSQQWRTTLVR